MARCTAEPFEDVSDLIGSNVVDLSELLRQSLGAKAGKAAKPAPAAKKASADAAVKKAAASAKTEEAA